MATDAKYGRITVEHEPGTPFGEDEPVFLLRARDLASVDTIIAYHEKAEAYGAPAAHLAGVSDVLRTFARWQAANVDDLKVPD